MAASFNEWEIQMITYNSYEASKIANPNEVIYTACGNFYALKGRFTVTTSEPLIACNPADHCMTVEKFLADGHKFVEGDLIFNTHPISCVEGIKRDFVDNYNCPDIDDDKRYILRAETLKQKDNIPKIHPDSEFYKKPRAKVEYVKCEFDSMWEAVKAFEGGEVFHTHFISDGWVIVEHVQQVIPNLQLEKLYRRIETLMTERDELLGALQSVWIIDGIDGKEQLEKIVDSGLFKLVN